MIMNLLENLNQKRLMKQSDGHLSNEELHAKLATVDEAGAKDIHPNNRSSVSST